MTLHAECPKESAWEDYKAARSHAQYSPEVQEELDALFERWSELDNIADAKGYENEAANAKADDAWREYETAKEQAEYPAEVQEELDTLFAKWTGRDSLKNSPAEASDAPEDVTARARAAWEVYEKYNLPETPDAPEAPPLDPFDRGDDEDAPWETGEGFYFTYCDQKLYEQEETYAYFLMETR